MDRGIPTEEVLAEMRSPEREGFYLVGTPRGKIQQFEKKWLELPWRKVGEWVEVKLFAEQGELYVLAKSQGRRAKEHAIRRRKLVRLLWKLRDLRRKSPGRDQLLLRLGAAKSDTTRAAHRFWGAASTMPRYLLLNPMMNTATTRTARPADMTLKALRPAPRHSPVKSPQRVAMTTVEDM